MSFITRKLIDGEMYAGRPLRELSDLESAEAISHQADHDKSERKPTKGSSAAKENMAAVREAKHKTERQISVAKSKEASSD